MIMKKDVSLVQQESPNRKSLNQKIKMALCGWNHLIGNHQITELIKSKI